MNAKPSRTIGFLLPAMALVLGAAGARAADLTVTVEGVRSGGNQAVVCGLFKDRATYPFQVKAATATGRRAAQSGSAVVRIDAAAGDYALACWHDANGNGVVDTNALGIPNEGVGFGNNAPVNLGPPTFKAATVSVSPQGGATSLRLRY